MGGSLGVSSPRPASRPASRALSNFTDFFFLIAARTSPPPPRVDRVSHQPSAIPHHSLAPAHRLQPRTFDPDGKNQATVDHVKRGQMHTQCLLDELGLGSFDEWIGKIAGLSTGEPLRLEINPVLVIL